MTDPRYSQIAILASLSLVGSVFRGVDINLLQLSLSLSAALTFQYLCSRAAGISFEWRSALITGFSLALLLRIPEPYWAIIAAALAVCSKFLIRSSSRHMFNPANFAIVVLLLLSDQVWVSPGQWGSEWVLMLLLLCFGITVLMQTRQWDIAFVFLAVYGTLLFGRAWYLNDVFSIPMHQLKNGALLIFAFFMLSDPKTIPPRLYQRALFATVVACIGFYLRFYHYINEAIFYALFVTCLAYACVIKLRLTHTDKRVQAS